MLLPDADRDPKPVSHDLLQYKIRVVFLKQHNWMTQEREDEAALLSAEQTIYVQALHSTLHFTVKAHLKQSKASQHAGPQQ